VRRQGAHLLAAGHGCRCRGGDRHQLPAAGALDLLAGQVFLDRELLLARGASEAYHGGSSRQGTLGRAQRFELLDQFVDDRADAGIVALGFGTPEGQRFPGAQELLELVQARSAFQNVPLQKVSLRLRQAAQKKAFQFARRWTGGSGHWRSLKRPIVNALGAYSNKKGYARTGRSLSRNSLLIDEPVQLLP
jgi:hypothetical protein